LKGDEINGSGRPTMNINMQKCNNTYADAVVGRGNTDVENVIYGLIDPMA
jgi:hypothetical protein